MSGVDAFGLKDLSFRTGNSGGVTKFGFSDDSDTDVVVGNFALGQPTPVPVPASIWLLGTALAGLWTAGRKRQA